MEQWHGVRKRLFTQIITQISPQSHGLTFCFSMLLSNRLPTELQIANPRWKPACSSTPGHLFSNRRGQQLTEESFIKLLCSAQGQTAAMKKWGLRTVLFLSRHPWYFGQGLPGKLALWNVGEPVFGEHLFYQKCPLIFSHPTHCSNNTNIK